MCVAGNSDILRGCYTNGDVRYKEVKHHLTLKLLMSHIYGAFILDVSRSHDAPQSVGLLWTSDQLVAETST